MTCSKVLIANRGVIVERILRTLKNLSIQSVVVYSEADRDQPYISKADESFSLGDGPSSTTYLDIEKLLEIAHHSGADAIHPGYGFISENAAYIERCEAEGLVWLGPTANQVRQFGYKHKARELAMAAGVPLVPGTGLMTSVEDAQQQASQIGYPVILKSTAGGGGIGMQVCATEADLRKNFESVKQLSERNFGDGDVFLEAFVSQARHIEVQIFGDGEGEVIAIGERDCSTQRRNQKVVEECPAPHISEHTRVELHRTAIQLGKLVQYRSVGTVEFIYDAQREQFFFLEMNTRLQVEHGVTEMVYGLDLVELMVKLGSNKLPPLSTLKLDPHGCAIQVRLYAEDPAHDFRPSAGTLSEVNLVTPKDGAVRVDATIETGSEVSSFFDPMLAKFIRWAETRSQAISGLVEMLNESQIYGIVTNKDWLVDVLLNEHFTNPAKLSTRWLNSFQWTPKHCCEILKPGAFTTIQDYPGRQGYWDVGVPPSGPFDDWSFQLGNKFLGNEDTASGLEITLTGPIIRFYDTKEIIITGGTVPIKLNDRELKCWTVIKVVPGDILEIGKVSHGMRAYLLVSGGFDCPEYLGSRSTFTLGDFGGHVGRPLRSGDRLLLNSTAAKFERGGLTLQNAETVAPITTTWDLHVMYGPHGAPDFFLDEDIKMFFEHEWEVHYNSSRTGVRLIGPRPQWARKDGGEGGLHPSNLHDNAYAFGAVDFTGDMPIILGPDGPSLGGFVCPVVLIRSERWKMGQLAPGDKVKFVPVSVADARALDDQRQAILTKVFDNNIDVSPISVQREVGSPIVKKTSDGIVYRYAGDDFLLIEFGPMELDIALRFRAHAWMLWLQERKIDAIIDLTPGIRSLQIHYDPSLMSLDALMALLAEAERDLVRIEDLELDTREVWLPLSWNDDSCQYAIDHYQKTVWPKAPWCPSNLEFIRRINGLTSIEQVCEIVFSASYLVLGLGDVYLGAPVATPLDPSQRLVTTKYNPARTWTAENSVGIGGSYLCVYSAKDGSPGGYQLVGRTVQMWNRYRKTEFFEKPWLLRFFDQLRFYPVSHDELMQMRKDFPHGRFPLKVRSTKFKLADYLASLESKSAAIQKFKKQREAAFQDEITMWHEKGLFTFEEQHPEAVDQTDTELAKGESSIDVQVSGSVWKILVKEGDIVKPDQPVLIAESMKMEFNVVAETPGVVARVLVTEGAMITAGQPVIVLRELSEDAL